MDSEDLLKIRLQIIEVELIRLESLAGFSMHPDHHFWTTQRLALKDEHVIVMNKLGWAYDGSKT